MRNTMLTVPALNTIAPHRIVQIGWSVDDIDSAVARWVKNLGVGPFYALRNAQFNAVTYRGRPSVFDHSAAFSQWGQYQVELMQQHGEYPSVLRDICPANQTAIVSFSWFVDDLAAETRRMNSLGFATAFTASEVSIDLRLAWFDTRSVLGAMAEVYQENPASRVILKKVSDAAAGWDGQRPLRGFGELLSPTEKA
jgi:Glyoxalase/Bleomycin resistance protein/Dioxygenase superfamily